MGVGKKCCVFSCTFFKLQVLEYRVGRSYFFTNIFLVKKKKYWFLKILWFIQTFPKRARDLPWLVYIIFSFAFSLNTKPCLRRFRTNWEETFNILNRLQNPQRSKMGMFSWVLSVSLLPFPLFFSYLVFSLFSGFLVWDSSLFLLIIFRSLSLSLSRWSGHGFWYLFSDWLYKITMACLICWSIYPFSLIPAIDMNFSHDIDDEYVKLIRRMNPTRYIISFLSLKKKKTQLSSVQKLSFYVFFQGCYWQWSL